MSDNTEKIDVLKLLGIERETDLIKEVPDELNQSLEFKYITDAVNPEFNLIATFMRKIVNNVFPDTADEDGVKHFETFLNIVPQPDQTLEERKEKIKAKINEILPYTWILLHKLVASLVGWGNFQLKRDGAKLIFELYLTEVDRNTIDSIFDMFERIVPMNLYWEFNQKFSYDSNKLKMGIGSVISNRVVIPASKDNTHRRYIPEFIYMGAQIKKKIILK